MDPESIVADSMEPSTEASTAPSELMDGPTESNPEKPNQNDPDPTGEKPSNKPDKSNKSNYSPPSAFGLPGPPGLPGLPPGLPGLPPGLPGLPGLPGGGGGGGSGGGSNNACKRAAGGDCGFSDSSDSGEEPPDPGDNQQLLEIQTQRPSPDDPRYWETPGDGELDAQESRHYVNGPGWDDEWRRRVRR
jgi:hypothetical protein